MPNKNYLRGRRLEYDIVEDFIKNASEGSWAQRMAGSHSPYDVIGVDPVKKEVHFIQAKTKLVKENTIGAISEYQEGSDWRVVMYKLTKFIKRRGQ